MYTSHKIRYFVVHLHSKHTDSNGGRRSPGHCWSHLAGPSLRSAPAEGRPQPPGQVQPPNGGKMGGSSPTKM